MVAIEAIYIFDEHNKPVLEHVYAGRPPSAGVLLSQYLSYAAPRPSLIYLPNAIPATLLFSLIQDRLLFLCPTSADVEPLLVLEFLHRFIDSLEEFLGAPLLTAKIEGSYDVVAQIAGEVCDAGVVSNTEPNALREIVEAPSWMGSILGGFGLPSSLPVPNQPSNTLQRPSSALSSGTLGNTPASSTGPQVSWRRSNVRHTSNELYVDIVETLSVILAPSGMPLSAVANGSILFNAQISGVPDLLLKLTVPGGSLGIQNAMALPCFHPCVRLARWRDRPGELSFVPPDGKFMLAGYECDLLPDLFTSPTGKIPNPTLNLPASADIRTSLGQYGDEVEVRLTLNPRTYTVSNSTSAAATMIARGLNATNNRFSSGSASANTSTGNSVTTNTAAIEDIVVNIPIAPAVRKVDDLRPMKGEAQFLAAERILEWRISTREAATIGSGSSISCRFTLVGPSDDNDTKEAHVNGQELKTDTFDYDENDAGGNPHTRTRDNSARTTNLQMESTEARDLKRVQQNAQLMPKSANLSFSSKGWLASGIKVDSLVVNTKTSTGLGSGVTPYKGVKYHTISQEGIEIRC